MSSNRQTVYAAALTLLCIAAGLWPAFHFPVLPMDEGTLLVYPELILEGKLPYRDFETFYGPGNLWFLAGAYAVFGVDLLVARSVGLLYHLAIFLGIFVVLRRQSLVVAVGGALLGALLLRAVQLPPFAWLGGIACALWAIILLSQPKAPWRAAVGGFLGGAALLYRPDLAPAVLLSSAPLFLLLTRDQRLICAGGFIVAMVPMAVLTFAAGFQETLNNVFLLPVFGVNSGRRLPVSYSPPFVAHLLWLHFGAVVCNVLAGVLGVVRDRESRPARLFLAAGLLALGLTHQALQRADTIHVLFTAFFSVALLPASLALLLARGREVSLTPVRAWAGLGAVAVLTAVLALEPTHFFYRLVRGSFAGMSAPVAAKGREVPLRSIEEALHVQKLVSALERFSAPGERVFVGPGDLRRTCLGDTYLYHLLPWLEPASYFLEMNPLSANRQNSRLADDVATADWLILNRRWDRWAEPNDSAQFGSDGPNEIVRTRFDLKGQLGSFELYQKRKALSSATR